MLNSYSKRPPLLLLLLFSVDDDEEEDDEADERARRSQHITDCPLPPAKQIDPWPARHTALNDFDSAIREFSSVMVAPPETLVSQILTVPSMLEVAKIF